MNELEQLREKVKLLEKIVELQEIITRQEAAKPQPVIDPRLPFTPPYNHPWQGPLYIYRPYTNATTTGGTS